MSNEETLDMLNDWANGTITMISDKCLSGAIVATETIEKIKDIICEKEHYEVSNSIDNPYPNKADYDTVHADKFNRIWKVISDMESKLN